MGIGLHFPPPLLSPRQLRVSRFDVTVTVPVLPSFLPSFLSDSSPLLSSPLLSGPFLAFPFLSPRFSIARSSANFDRQTSGAQAPPPPKHAEPTAAARAAARSRLEPPSRRRWGKLVKLPLVDKGYKVRGCWHR